MFNIKYLLLYLLIYGKNIVENANSPEGDRSSTLPGAGSTDSGNKTGIELSIKATAATNEFDHKKDGNTVTYTAKGGNGFKIVKQKNTEIWKAKDESEYATKVVLEGKGKKDKKVTIQLPNNTTRVFNRNSKGKPWTDVSPSAKDPVKTTCTTSASGANGQSPDQGSHGPTDKTNLTGSQSTTPPALGTGTGGGTENGEGGTGTGGSTTPKTGGGTESSSGGSPGTGGGGTGTGGGTTHTSGGGSTNESGQGGGGGTPANQANDPEQTKTPENTAKELKPEEYPKDIKVFKADPNDAANTAELTNTEYKVKKVDDYEYIYEFNDGVNCTLLKREEKEVWKFDSSKNSGKYPKSMTVMKETVFIDFDGSKEVYSKAGDEWFLNKSVTNMFNKGKSGGQ
ncbi:hypothetical protein MACJ_003886 [Theileria orientalis]|uniref:SfiI-subtelomeric related protein family member n=1 Tax=Theileria orientalis TaxID=68886 RepID=A0A976SKP7_THEOR|nr:hypothetical protein MACJ_003886 [Theileria orientalis]